MADTATPVAVYIGPDNPVSAFPLDEESFWKNVKEPLAKLGVSISHGVETTKNAVTNAGRWIIDMWKLGFHNFAFGAKVAGGLATNTGRTVGVYFIRGIGWIARGAGRAVSSGLFAGGAVSLVVATVAVSTYRLLDWADRKWTENIHAKAVEMSHWSPRPKKIAVIKTKLGEQIVTEEARVAVNDFTPNKDMVFVTTQAKTRAASDLKPIMEVGQSKLTAQSLRNRMIGKTSRAFWDAFNKLTEAQQRDVWTNASGDLMAIGDLKSAAYFAGRANAMSVLIKEPALLALEPAEFLSQLIHAAPVPETDQADGSYNEGALAERERFIELHKVEVVTV